jgi:glycosyltransferase involved in cell wall biosynthesis
VGSAAALEGIPLLEGRDALAATGPPDWVRCIAGLWDDPARRDDLGRNARRYVEANHRWETCLGRFDELVSAPDEAPVPRRA